MRGCILTSALIAILVAAVPAKAEDKLCNVYGDLGQSVADYILPFTIQEMVDMVTGQNPAAMGGFTRALMNGISPENLGVLATSNQADIELLGKYAGQIAMQSLMSGQIPDTSKVGEALFQQCNAIGSEALLQRFRQADAALQGQ